jgi:hypothetical protein
MASGEKVGHVPTLGLHCTNDAQDVAPAATSERGAKRLCGRPGALVEEVHNEDSNVIFVIDAHEVLH